MEKKGAIQSVAKVANLYGVTSNLKMIFLRLATVESLRHFELHPKKMLYL